MLDNVKLAIGIVIVAGLVGFHFWDKQTGIDKAVSDVTISYQAAIDRRAREALETQGELMLKAKISEEEKNEQIVKLATNLDVAVKRLSNRPSRPTDSSANPRDSSACTGRELYREDGEFLTREAHRAEKVRMERDFYYERYEYVRNQLDKFIEDGKNR